MARLNRLYRLGWSRSRANHGRKPNKGKVRYTFHRGGARLAGKRKTR